jgi:CRISPR-associated protein Cas5d
MRLVYLKVWGDYACFSRPEMNVERVSYSTITPSAARGILTAIYWKPEMSWEICELHTLKPPRYINIKRNEVGKISTLRTPYINIMESRQQRFSMILKKVEYLIVAKINTSKDEINKHYSIFERRALKGQCYYNPYLGCREFPAHFELVDKPEKHLLDGEYDLGWMFYDYDYSKDTEPKFFHAISVDGVVKVPSYKEVFDR